MQGQGGKARCNPEVAGSRPADAPVAICIRPSCGVNLALATSRRGAASVWTTAEFAQAIVDPELSIRLSMADEQIGEPVSIYVSPHSRHCELVELCIRGATCGCREAACAISHPQPIVPVLFADEEVEVAVAVAAVRESQTLAREWHERATGRADRVRIVFDNLSLRTRRPMRQLS
jgi:hypothetical protein